MQNIRKIKKNLILLLTITCCFIYAEETTDLINKDEQNEQKKIIKFRGNVGINFNYKFGVLDGIAKNNISGVKYKVIDFTDDDNEHVSKDKNGRIIGSKFGNFGGKLLVNYNIIIPIYLSSNPALSKNNFTISFNSTLGISNFFTGSSLSISPISLLSFTSGFSFGTAWRYRQGAGFQKIVDDELQSINGPIIMKVYLNTSFQISLDNFMLKKYKRWTGVYTTSSIEFQYYNILTEDDKIAYQGGGSKENYDGWKLSSNFKIGYKIPIIPAKDNENKQFLKKNVVKFIIHKGIFFSINSINLTHFLDSQMKDKGWGSDFIYITFGPYLRFDLPYNLYCNLSMIIKNDIKYTHGTIGNLDFQTREYDDWYLYLDGIQLNVGWKF
jgi:hypothetical protein